jgi:hypothetical protein
LTLLNGQSTNRLNRPPNESRYCQKGFGLGNCPYVGNQALSGIEQDFTCVCFRISGKGNQMKKIKLILPALLLILLPDLAKAQSVKGSIFDDKKAPFPYATILLKHSGDSVVYRSTLSSDLGLFSFQNIKAGNYDLSVSLIGFEKLERQAIYVDAEKKITDLGILVLKTSAQMLNSVTIRGETPMIERRIDRTVVNIDKNITNAGATVLEVMKKLPGVQVRDDGQISLNGRSGVNIMIDGKPAYLSAEDLAGLLNGMAASNVQKIEIMTNPSSKYDASGNAGMINIVKKKNHKEGFTGSVNGNIEQGYFGRCGGSLNLSYKTDKYNLSVSNNYTYAKSFANRTVTTDALDNGNALLTEEASNNNNISSIGSYMPSFGLDLNLSKNSTLSLSGNAGFRANSDNTFSTMIILDANRKLTNIEDFAALNKDKPVNYTTGATFTHQLDTLGKAFSVDLDLSNFQYMPGQYNYTRLNDPSGNFAGQSKVFLDQSRKLNIYAIKADYSQQLSGKGKLEAGLKSSYVKANNDNTYYIQVNGQFLIDSTQSDYSVNSENINAVYVNFNRECKRLTIQAGLRAEQTVMKGNQLLTGESIDQNFLSLFPTTFFDYKLNDKDDFTVRLSRRIERSDYHELIPFRRPLTPSLYFEGDPNLKPQRTWHGELTYSWHSEFFVTLGYDIDRDYVLTLPYLDSNKVTVTRIPTNIRHSGSWNLDLTYSKKLTKWWSTDNTVSLYQNRFNGQISNFSLNNPGILTLYLSANNSFPLTNDFAAECDFQYNSKRQLMSSSFGAYSTVSIGLQRQLFNGKGSISLHVNNVFQSKNHNTIDRYENLYQYSYFNFYTRALRVNVIYRFGSGKVVKSKKQSSSEDEQKRAGS